MALGQDLAGFPLDAAGGWRNGNGVELKQALQQHFGHGEFRPGQESVVRALLDGHSALALFPTGAGKSLCYQLPAVLGEGTALVVSPLIALMKDQVEALRARGIAAARLDSTLTADEAQQVLEDFRAGRLKLLYVAPERFASEAFLHRIRQAVISLLAIDEAHCISEWGHNFRPDYLRLARMAKDLGLGPVLTLTATATPAVASDIRRAFDIAEAHHVQTSFHRPNLHLRVSPVTADQRLALLTKRLGSARIRPAIVYVTLQQTAEDVAGHLARSGLKAKPYHAGLPDELRSTIQDGFMRGDTEIIVATIAFGMGIDKADIRSVFHFNLPKTLENYQQEIGRAGRDGKPSLCEMLACADDRIVLENFTFGDTPAVSAIRSLVGTLLGQGDEFDISRYDVSQATDIRPLVVETVIAYLELEGLLQPVRSFYEGYRIELIQPEARILAGHTPERQRFLAGLFGASKKGWKYLTLKVDEAAAALGEPRDRLIKALTWLEEAGDVRLKPEGLRQMFRRTGEPASREPGMVAPRLHELFLQRERRDIERLDQVVELATHPGCHTARLLAHFGESLPDDRCGHCDRCRDGFLAAAAPLPASPVPDLTHDDIAAIARLRDARHPALNSARSMARFLCGITSPATTRAKLTRSDDFGRLSAIPFRTVLATLQELGLAGQ